jgi:hypothetical protein
LLERASKRWRDTYTHKHRERKIYMYICAYNIYVLYVYMEKAIENCGTRET